MAALPSALAIQASQAWRRVPPRSWMAKSTTEVVPPKAAAMVPDSKSSAEVVPPNGMSRWVCTSIPPGTTNMPAASITLSAGPSRLTPTAAMVSSSIRTSPRYRSVAVTPVPFLISVFRGISSGQLLDHAPVGLRPPVPVELPHPPDLLDHRQVHLRHHQLVLVLAAGGQEVTARVDEIAGAVELADIPRRLGADPVGTAHEVAVGHRVGRL